MSFYSFISTVLLFFGISHAILAKNSELAQLSGPATYSLSLEEYLAPRNGTNVTIQVDFTPGNRGWSGAVAYVSSNGTAVAGADYQPVDGTIAFSGPAPGFFNVPIKIDSTEPGEKTVKLYLFPASGDSGTILRSNAVLRLIDNPAGIVSFARSRLVVSETQGFATIDLIRTKGSEGSLTIDYRQAFWWEGGSSRSFSGSLTFASGQTSLSFMVPVSRTDAVEGEEIVRIVLTESYGPDFHLGSKKLELVIRDMPDLEIVRSNGKVAITWPDDGVEYILEAASDLTFATNAAVNYFRKNGFCCGEVSTASAGFFRLKKPASFF